LNLPWICRIVGAVLKRAAGAIFLCVALPAASQDFMAVIGASQSDAPRARSYGWLLSYSRDLSSFLTASFSYQNEGHVPSHHRDGHSVQLWARTTAFSPNLTLSAGAGPYRYFDTTVAETTDGFENAHGWGALYSVAATWRRPSSPWFYQLRFDRVDTRGSIDTSLVMLGVGYHFEQDGSFADNAIAPEMPARGHEVAILGGTTIVNSFESQNSSAKSIEYRHSLGPVLRGSLAWLNEGDARLIRRDGVLAQAWLEPSFYRNRFTLGLGFGAYLAVDDYRHDRSTPGLLGVLTSTMSYHFSHGVVGRVLWHRIVSNYNRDSDIILVGLGYRF
jgi:hypothetical protein